jgi:hypothetical protein
MMQAPLRKSGLSGHKSCHYSRHRDRAFGSLRIVQKFAGMSESFDILFRLMLPQAFKCANFTDFGFG